MAAPRLYTLIAELTYRCPLRCLYCSNPVNFASIRDELTTHQWSEVFRQASALGVLQLHLTGGEPTLRADLPQLIRTAREADLYVNLITGGTLLTEQRLTEFRDCGLDHVQLSLQDSDREAGDMVAGARTFERKLSAAELIRKSGLPLTLNIVLHRFNISRISEMIELALEFGATRLELANTQYYAWALENRDALIPNRIQYAKAEKTVLEARERYREKIEIAFVRADYFTDQPKACMGGWGSSYACVKPDGEVLPCHAASVITGLRFENVRDKPLQEIWLDSPGFNAFRGDDWMVEPCRSCPKKKLDFGGCRCQAFMMTGDARATDPVCQLSSAHQAVLDALKPVNSTAPPLLYRDAKNSRRLSAQQ